MAVKHAIIKPLRHAGIASQDRVYISGGAIVEGAPVIYEAATGKVIEITDLDAGGGLIATGKILGVALNATTAANQDVMVALALPGRRFVSSLAANLTAAAASDTGASALALTDLGTRRELHKDDTTLKWLLGAAAGAIGTNAAPLVTNLLDKVGSTTNDTPSFGSSGRGPSVAGTPPNATFQDDPVAGPNFGLARVEFIFPVADTIFG